MKIAEWEQLQEKGYHEPSSLETEGFIHFSTKDQVLESATRHYSNESLLKVVGLTEAICGPALKWEKSRKGELFPHLYQKLLREHIQISQLLIRNQKNEWEWKMD